MSKEYDKGYNDAIEEIRRRLNGGANPNPGGEGPTNPDPTEDDLEEIPIQDPNANGTSGGQSKDNKHTDRGNSKNATVQWGKDSEKENEKKGTSGVAGGFIDEKRGNDIAQSEGYKPSNENVAEKWKRIVDKAMDKFPGNKGGDYIREKLGNIYKTTTNWKEALRKILGRCINDDSSRQGWASKNVLASQNRPARTDKDEDDALEYMTIMVDTSSSMNQELLVKVMCEAYSIALSKKPMNIMVIQCDTRITEVKIFDRMQDFERYCKTIKLKGGGGTDFEDVWAFMDGKQSKFKSEYIKFRQATGGKTELMMVLTDGYVNLVPLKRVNRTMDYLIWGIFGNAGFTLPKQNQERNTGVILLPINE